MVKLMGPIGTGVFLIGTLSLVVGVFLLLLGVRSSGSMDTQWGKFSGPVWFILIAFGFVLQVIGAMSPV
jgi:hypothetical protein